MKYRWDKKYLYWGVTAFSVIACSLLFYYGIFHLAKVKEAVNGMINILMPIIYGLAIGYLLSPIVNFVEKKWFYPLFFNKMKINNNKKNKSRIRTLSILISIFFMLLIIFSLFALLIPQLISSISNLVISFPTYYDNFEKLIVEILEKNPELEASAAGKLSSLSRFIENFINTTVLPSVNEIIMNLSTGLMSIVNLLKNFVIGTLVSIYVLGSKELFAAQSKKLVYSLFKTNIANSIIKNVRFTNEMFSGFIVGKIIDSAIIGLICFVVTAIIGTPYYVLVSVIIGVTNVIPFFGPYLGAVPCAVLILLVNPLQSVYFVIFIIILQTFDGNILGPKILGDSTGLSSFWVIFAILTFGGIFGILGMFVGVPIFAVIYTGIKHVINMLLHSKNLSADTKDYMELENIDAITKSRIYMDKEKSVQDKKFHRKKENKEEDSEKE